MDKFDFDGFMKETTSVTVGGVTAAGSISLAGIGGFSAAGITSGLATLGAGSMLGGVFIVPLIGYGAYKLSKELLKSSEEEVTDETVYRERPKRTKKKKSTKTK